jgi:glycosyltransferase involved in cell wall biosynthesis
VESQVMPLVTIGLPVYNGERFLRPALDSILAQTHADVEVIISDNASTDGTGMICREYAGRDPRVRYRCNASNLGAAPNYNILVDLAQGDYFKWASHDDVLAPTYIAQCVQALTAHPEAVLCYPSTVVIDEEGATRGNEPGEILVVGGEQPHRRFREFLESTWVNRSCNAVVGVIRRRDLALTGKIGAFASSDRILLSELALRGTFIYLDEPLFFRRKHAAGSVSSNPDFASRTKWFDPTQRKGLLPPHWRWLREYHRVIGRSDLSVGERLRCSFQLCRYVQLARRQMWEESKDLLRGLMPGENRRKHD